MARYTASRAIVEHLQARYPHHTAKLVARDIDCTVKAAESILMGHLSSRSIDKLFAKFGWELAVDIAQRGTGTTMAEYAYGLV